MEKLRERSPNYPQVPLKDAIELAKQLYNNVKRSAVAPADAVKAWGHTMFSGPANTKVSALLKYGLLEKEGKEIKISPLMLSILHPGAGGQEEYSEVLKKSALTPPIFREINDKYHDVSEEILVSHLIRNKGFTQEAASKLAKIYKQNVIFAKLKDSATLAPDEIQPLMKGSVSERTIVDYESTAERKAGTSKHFYLSLDDDVQVEVRFKGGTILQKHIDYLSEMLDVAKKRLPKEKEDSPKE